MFQSVPTRRRGPERRCVGERRRRQRCRLVPSQHGAARRRRESLVPVVPTSPYCAGAVRRAPEHQVWIMNHSSFQNMAGNYRNLQAIVQLNLYNCSPRIELNGPFDLPAGSISTCQECCLKCVHLHIQIRSPAVPLRTGIAFSELQDT